MTIPNITASVFLTHYSHYLRVTTDDGITTFIRKSTNEQFIFDHNGTNTKLGYFMQSSHPNAIEDIAYNFRDNIARAFTQDIATDQTNITIPTNMDDASNLTGKMNAISSGPVGKEFRHLAVQAYITIKFGEGEAKLFGDFYERFTKPQENDRSFDLINNQRGRDLGNSLRGQADMSSKKGVEDFLNIISDMVKSRYNLCGEGESKVFNEHSRGLDELLIKK